jgi:hypothetical protein
MSKVMQYVKYIRKCVESSRNWFRVKYINDVKCRQDKALCHEKSIGGHGYSYRGTSQIQTPNKS